MCARHVATTKLIVAFDAIITLARGDLLPHDLFTHARVVEIQIHCGKL